MSASRALDPCSRRVARVVAWAMFFGIAPLACELTVDLDKLRGPMGGAGGGTSVGGGGGGGQGPDATGGGGDAVVTHATILHAPSNEPPYDGSCEDAFWKGSDPFHWSSRKDGIDATCRLAWAKTGTTNGRTILGCCDVTAPALSLSDDGGVCNPVNDDGLEYLFETVVAGQPTTAYAILSASGRSCDHPGKAYDINHVGTYLKPDTVSPQDIGKDGKSFHLVWAVDLDPTFSTDIKDPRCTVGVRSRPAPHDDGSYGQLTLTGGDNLYGKRDRVPCTFAP